MNIIKYTNDHNMELMTLKVEHAGKFNDDETVQINQSLEKNGIVVVKEFLTADQLESIAQDGLKCVHPGFDAGKSLGAIISSRTSPSTNEFSHPFLVSKAATDVALNPAIIDIIERYLENSAIVHHAIFQQSFPLEKAAVDWHVDTGSNKALNGLQRFPDRRLRMIVYLNEVKTGGLSYLLDTRAATNYFLNLPIHQQFPEDMIPSFEGRKVTINESAGTIILFDAHGLHRPEPPADTRLVLNVWFARTDFSADLPPVLVDMANISKSGEQKSYIFKNSKNYDIKIELKVLEKNETFISKVKRYIKKT